jgi:tetratricopeptide (TPR) repeat protein
LGKVDEAMPHLQAALVNNPSRGSYNYTYGMLLLQKGQYDEAIAYLRKAVAADPCSADAHDGLGTALLATHKPDQALVELRKAIIANPNLGAAQADLGDVLYSFGGDAAEAVDHWRKAVSIDADQESVLSQLAWVLATSPDASIRNGAEAVKDAQRAMQLSGGNDAKSVDTLAAALAESNRFTEAVEQGKRALSLAIQARNRQLADAVSARIALYEMGMPYRENRGALTPR